MGPTPQETEAELVNRLLDVPQTPGEALARRRRRRSLLLLLISALVLFLIVPAGEFAVLSVAQKMDESAQHAEAKEEAEEAKHPSGVLCISCPNFSNQNCFPGCGSFLFGVSGTLVAALLAFGTLPLSILGCSNALRARPQGRGSGRATVLYVLNLLCGAVAGLAALGLLAFFIFIADSISSTLGT